MHHRVITLSLFPKYSTPTSSLVQCLGRCLYSTIPENKQGLQDNVSVKQKSKSADTVSSTGSSEDKLTPEATRNDQEKPYSPQSVTKEDMKWRTPWHEKEGQYFSALRSFSSEDSQVNALKFLHTPLNLSPSAIKKWWKDRQVQKEIALQAYIPERNQILGNELAAAHFIVYRRGAVKFYNEDKWIKANDQGQYNLPTRFTANKYLEAIDCSDVDLYYEGLANLAGLKKVKWLSLNGCDNIDDWCLDKISNIFSHSLIYLDLRDCPNISERGIGALYKMKHLKILYLDNFLRNTRYEMTCLLLQDVNPHLDIRSDSVFSDAKH